MRDCSTHAGKNNEGSRGHLDRLIPMRGLPENQSGDGRHKCPYCAYQAGYRQALADVRDRLKRLDSVNP